MRRFQAIRGHVGGDRVHLMAEDGSAIEIARGDVVAVYRGERGGAVQIAADLKNDLRVIVEQTTFAAAAFLGPKSTGNPALDVDRIGLVLCRLGEGVVMVRLPSPQPSPLSPPPSTMAPSTAPSIGAPAFGAPAFGAPSFGAPAFAAPSAPQPNPALLALASEDDFAAPMNAPLNAPLNAAQSSPANAVFAPGADVPVPPSWPPRPEAKGPVCTGCDCPLRDAKSHYVINERPWCETCGFASLEPPIGAGVWLVARVAASAALVATVWFASMRQQLTLIAAGPAAFVTLLAAGFLFFRGDRPPYQPAERRAGPPGKGGAVLPLHPPEHLAAYARRIVSDEVTTLVAVAVVVVVAVVGHFTFARPVERWPDVLQWRTLEYVQKGAQTLGGGDVTVARYFRPKQPPNAASSAVALLRGSIPASELRSVIDAARDPKIPVYETVDIDKTTWCIRVPQQSNVDLYVITTVGPCAWGGCAVQGAADAEVRGTCTPPKETVAELKALLKGSWAK